MYARYAQKRGPMADPAVYDEVLRGLLANRAQGFDRSTLERLIEDRCGRYVRGDKRGKLKGWAAVTFVTRGGWRKRGPGYMNGYVVAPGQIVAVEISDYGRILFAESL